MWWRNGGVGGLDLVLGMMVGCYGWGTVGKCGDAAVAAAGEGGW